MADQDEAVKTPAPGQTLGKDIYKVLDELAMQRVADDTRMQCKVCWWVYDPQEGCPEWNIEPGVPFKDLPEHFCCPDCGHPKTAFYPVEDDIG